MTLNCLLPAAAGSHNITVVTVLQNVRMIYILIGNRRPAKKLNKN